MNGASYNGAISELTKARFTLSGCESDRYKVGYDPIHIRFGSASRKFAFTLSG